MSNERIVDHNELRIYYSGDFVHREDGPAKIWNDGYEEWWINNKLHREDGPAVVENGGKCFWFIDNNELSEQKFIEWKLLNFLK